MDESSESRKLQFDARNNIMRILDEQERLHAQLLKRKRELNSWTRELDKRKALTGRDRQKLEDAKQKNDVMNNELNMASEELMRADENVLRLLEEQKKEKEAALKKIFDLERALDNKQKLEMYIEELKGKIEVMKYLGGRALDNKQTLEMYIEELKGKIEVMKHLGDDEAVQRKLKELNEELEKKNEEMQGVEDMYKALLMKENRSNDELESARKVLIEGLKDSSWKNSSWEHPEDSFKALKPLMLQGEGNKIADIEDPTDQCAEVMHLHVKAMNGTFVLGRRVYHLEVERAELEKKLAKSEEDLGMEELKSAELGKENEKLESQLRSEKKKASTRLTQLTTEKDDVVRLASEAEARAQAAEAKLVALEKEVYLAKKKPIMLEEDNSIPDHVVQQVKKVLGGPIFASRVKKVQSQILAEFVTTNSKNSPGLTQLVAAFKALKSLPDV